MHCVDTEPIGVHLMPRKQSDLGLPYRRRTAKRNATVLRTSPRR